MKYIVQNAVKGLLMTVGLTLFLASCQNGNNEENNQAALLALMNDPSATAEESAIINGSPIASRSAGDNTGDVIINEVAWMGTTLTYYDEWIELYNTTASDIDLNGWTLNSEDMNPAINLTGVIPANGYYLLERDDDNTVPGVTADQIFSGALDNGGDALTLTNNNGVVVDETGTSWAAGDNSNKYTMERINPAVSGTDSSNWSNAITAYDGGNGTPGAVNSVYNGTNPDPIPDPEPSLYQLISQVQGNGTRTPYYGEKVSVEAVVTADFQASSELKGFYIQEEESDYDGDDATSEGIFVYVGSKPVSVNVGDLVVVTGYATEYYDLTQITSPAVTLIESGLTLPAAEIISLPFADTAELEKYEGMRVAFDQTLTVTENYDLGRYGEILLSSGGRLMNPTNVATPGEEALAVQAANDLNRILVDDGSNIQNPYHVIHPAPELSMENTLRSGDTVTELEGVLHYAYDYYRVQPTGNTVYTKTNARTSEPASIGGSLKVASFNVLNYFNGDGLGGGFPTSRGASSAEEFTRQRDKIINAIVAMDADIVGLMEIENDGYEAESAIQDLVNGINEKSANVYAFVNPGVSKIGTDEIAVGIIYKTSTVIPVGDAAILDSSVDSRFIDTKNRPTLAQTFEEYATNGKITIAVNHLKSKGSACDDLNDPDTGDLQGNCNLTRTAAAEALVDWLETDPTASGDADYLIIGDLNSYAKEDPIVAIQNGGYTDLIDQYIGSDNAYSYVFYGQSGYLDHALASATLVSQVSGVTEWHINTDEPHVLDYNVEYKSEDQILSFYSDEVYRSSDHDPVLVGLNLNPTLGDTVHVDDLDGKSSRNGYKSWSASVTIYVVDENGNPVPDAVVHGKWNHGKRRNRHTTCVTSVAGSCSVQMNSIRNTEKSVIFKVTSIVHPDMDYVRRDNVESKIRLYKPGTHETIHHGHNQHGFNKHGFRNEKHRH